MFVVIFVVAESDEMNVSERRDTIYQVKARLNYIHI